MKIFLVGVLCLGVTLFSCKEGANAKNRSITIIKDTVQNSSENDLLYNLAQVKDLTAFTSMLTTSGMIDMLHTPGPFTVFAPTNKAFDDLPVLGKNELVTMLGYHIIAGEVKTTHLKNGDTFMSLSGKALVVSVKDSIIFINGKQIITHDIQSNNGVIHIIDGVLS